MPVRLTKALKELNVGLNTVVDFLQKKNMALDENVTPNTKISDEQYQLLVRAFGDDKAKNLETRIDIQNRKEKEQQEKAERKEKELHDRAKREAALKKKKEEELKAAEGEHKPIGLKVVGNINELKKETAKPAAEPVAEPVTKPAAKPASEAKPKPDSKPVAEKSAIAAAPAKPEPAKPEVAAPKHAAEPVAQVKVEAAEANDPIKFKTVGFIDLDNLNSKTRPDKKSKAERKKEREEKERQRQESRNKAKDTHDNAGKGAGEGGDKKKRQRINKGKVDINAAINQQPNQGGNGGQKGGRPNNNQNQQNAGNAKAGKKNKKKKEVKVELTDEEVAKQVKETLARLTTKQVKSSVKNRKEKRERHRLEAEEGEDADNKVLQLTEFVTANELATMMNVPVTKVIGTCMSIGMMVSINQRLDAETINIVAEEFGFTTNYVSEEVTHAIEEVEDADEDLVPRAPVITVMGHVDHGKTSLLDYIRKANVIAGEAGGITQHIGAYNVKMSNGKHITFLDTPGHEAFTAMRARGAKVTDIAIIIIAADDDVMPQTKEAIAHAVAANVPMVFAINKCDKPTANPEHIKEQLASMNYLVESWGGKYQDQEISAKKGIGVDELMEKVLLEAEILELKANPNRNATGSVIESSLDRGRGYVATVLVQNGTLHQGDVVLAGTAFGKIKAMFNERGQRIEQVLPAEPALILGLNGAPTAGDTFHVMDSEQEARELAHKRDQLKREQGLRTLKRVDLNELGRRIALGDFKELNLVVKGDVDGSIEALSDSLIKLSTEKIQVNVIHKAVGQISESDVTLAAASDAIIVGFQVRPSKAARALADQEGVDIRLYSVIYDTIEEIKSAMEGMLAPETKEEVTANLEVRQVYKITKVGTVAGAFVTSGKVQRSNKIRVVRDGIVVFTGQINALKRFKDDVKEVGTNFECGISIVNFDDIREGDILETFAEIEVKQKL